MHKRFWAETEYELSPKIKLKNTSKMDYEDIKLIVQDGLVGKIKIKIETEKEISLEEAELRARLVIEKLLMLLNYPRRNKRFKVDVKGTITNYKKSSQHLTIKLIPTEFEEVDLPSEDELNRLSSKILLLLYWFDEFRNASHNFLKYSCLYKIIEASGLDTKSNELSIYRHIRNGISHFEINKASKRDLIRLFGTNILDPKNTKHIRTISKYMQELEKIAIEIINRNMQSCGLSNFKLTT